ncbi:GNAT family N-acetyltransferase [Acetivibrio cellulolyticus]|uniref:GNAT family N-acetyltransferase n=1 Tax=Acetivibrio cellulolyticus TaxID=35830 RepID=UPI0001E2F565|nr:GNAT family N-acetyltransferase [Acetivibrio cellulolyticus]
MRIETNRLIIRDFERRDAEDLFKIVRQENIVRFMRDWSEAGSSPESYYGYIDWHQTQKNSTDIYENKRYVVALKDTDKMIGMVGMGLEDSLNEVEVAYFISNDYYKQGYGSEATSALVDWCFTNSDVPYLILTIDKENVPSHNLAEKCGFELFEKRIPIGHKQANMVSDTYFYYRKSNPKKEKLND